jgi:exportin-7
MLFDSLYPRVFPALVRGASLFAHDPQVTTALLKFVCELVFNKSNRILFDHCSANGILLFRETSKIACAFSRRIVALETPADDRYKLKYKGMGLCLTMLARALGGRYVNFGVFALYGDRALDSALEASLYMALTIPLPELLEFPKLAVAFYTYLSVIFRNHLEAVVTLDSPTFMRLVGALRQGLDSLDDTISSLSAAAIDHLATWQFRNGRKDTRPAKALAGHLAARPRLFADQLTLLFKVVLFTSGGCTNQWSLGKPVLSLILASDEAFRTVRKQLCATQSPEKAAQLEESFEKLIADIRPNLEQGNRDRFSQQLAIFRREVMKFLAT